MTGERAPLILGLRENFALKLISLAAAVVLWAYVSIERFPNTPVTRVVNAEVVPVGEPPSDVIVHFTTPAIPVTITGPKNQVDQIGDREVKAEFNVSSVRVGVTSLAGRPFKLPPSAPDVQTSGRPVVGVEVLPKERKVFRVAAELLGAPDAVAKYGPVHLSPETAAAVGSHDQLQRVVRLVVQVEASGTAVHADLPLKAVDRDNVEVAEVSVDPPKARVDVALSEAPATRTLIVSVPHRGQVAYPFQVVDIRAEPDQLTVVGKPDQLLKLGGLSTEEVDLTGMQSDFSREVRLQPLPPGVSVRGGRDTVRVNVRIRDTTRAAPP